METYVNVTLHFWNALGKYVDNRRGEICLLLTQFDVKSFLQN